MSVSLFIVTLDLEYLYHITAFNTEANRKSGDFHQLEFLNESEPYASELVNPKWFGLSPEFTAFYDSFVKRHAFIHLEYKTKRPLRLLDLRTILSDYENIEEYEELVRELEVDGHISYEDMLQIWLVRPSEIVEANPEEIDTYYRYDDLETLNEMEARIFTNAMIDVEKVK